MSAQIAQPLVSVVMATYNGSRFLREQLDSIVNQTYPNLEIIVVDDCSTDDTVAILNAYAAKYANIKVYVNEVNLGYVKNFEKGLLLSTANYISPCDQDDIWLPNKTEFLMAKLAGNAIVYCNSAIINEAGELTGKKLSETKYLQTYDDCLQYTIGNTAAGHAMILTRKTMLDSMPLPTMIPHDYWLGFVATFESQLLFVDEPLVWYRQHSANVFGVKTEGVKKVKKVKPAKEVIQAKARERMRLLYEKCPDYLTEQKAAFAGLSTSYESFSLINDFNRMRLFLKYRDRILAYKNRSEWRKILFSIKMFWMIK
ncbi:glycosyltransferase family 2 protein [uncultured Mucilaginibacter sp.]|uniref:glycosyltransferase family 2 protein n=1 Tax=uncultured Mucilaginibacter sp. TaxID=797541 RepID=UPI0025EDB5B2|nr:glycosyltransferase family 2 protein [uncultured Mucilaginibacter sp.]